MYIHDTWKRCYYILIMLSLKSSDVFSHRAEIRSKKLTCSDIEQKLRYDDQLRDLLRDQDNAEASLAKLSLKQVGTDIKIQCL